MDLDTPKHRLVFKDILGKLDSLQNLKTSNIFTATIPQLFYCFIIKRQSIMQKALPTILQIIAIRGERYFVSDLCVKMQVTL